MLDFQMAIPAQNLVFVNKAGTVAICTLWTPPKVLQRRLKDGVPELFQEKSPVVLLGGLYGGGLNILLRNLYFNPQIDTILLYGKDFAGSSEHLQKFFLGDIVRTGHRQVYFFENGENIELETISIKGKKSTYQMDELLLPDKFSRKPKIFDYTHVKEAELIDILQQFLQTYSPQNPIPTQRPEPILLLRPKISSFPSHPSSGVVVGDTILKTWEEILFRLSRFGVPVVFRKGKERLELRNFKAIVNNPQNYSWEEMAKEPYLLERSLVENYQEEILLKEIPQMGPDYTYGNRIRKYFGCDLLELVAHDLTMPSDSRHALVNLWDNCRDLKAKESPCLISLFFRKIEEKVHLTATFRSHNASNAWPVNCFGLLKVLELAVDLANQKLINQKTSPLTVGSITVISLSLTLNPDDLPRVAETISRRENANYQVVEDPNGYFKISLDKEAKEIVVEHYSKESFLLQVYRGKTSHALYQQLALNLAVSDLGHAMYLGSQLERAWYCLSKGLDYVQDKTKLC
ncbi:MAG: hypothetical protein LBF22_05820 [Deltaproteobacteria bacterium]|jgi:thymidylate synthase|nr:hypothetical protein [Deltaproteobacteria bacterium]